MKQRILIKSYGFFGDILFSIPAVIMLAQSRPADDITFAIGFPQPYEIVKTSLRHIPNVQLIVSEIDDPRVRVNESGYDQIFEMPECNRQDPPHIQYCRYLIPEIPNVYPKFVLSLPEEAVTRCRAILNRNAQQVFRIGMVANWDRCTVKYSDDYIQRIRISSSSDASAYLDHRFEIEHRRDIPKIINAAAQGIKDKIQKDVQIIPLGFPYGVSQRNQSFNSISTYTDTAALIRNCDIVVGPEGGMTNLAAGLNVPTIITTDFMWGLYGPYGLMQQLDDPQLGPIKFIPQRFPYAKHKSLQPAITDEEISNEIIQFATQSSLYH